MKKGNNCGRCCTGMGPGNGRNPAEHDCKADEIGHG